MTARRFIRVKAFQALFQLAHNFRISREDAIHHAITFDLNEIDEELSDLQLLKLALTNENIKVDSVDNIFDYLTEIVNGVLDNKEFIDEQIENRLEDWTIKRIDIPNLLILRIATYELYFSEDIDPSVVMNEAIEMTKSFNNDKASKFVNGVLQGILDTKEA